MSKKEYKKYLVSFLITVAIFATAFGIFNLVSQKKINQLQDMYEKISIDVLSIETQFDLLKKLPCEQAQNTTLSNQITNLGRKLSYMEKTLGYDNEEVQKLKKFYTLLQIKEMLLLKEVSTTCNQKPVFVIYFYSNKNCDECKIQGYILTKLSRNYPQLRIYSFDYDLDLNPIQALAEIYNVKRPLPAIVIQDKLLQGLQSYSALEEAINEVFNLEQPTTTQQEKEEN